jgi:hypothetical protein
MVLLPAVLLRDLPQAAAAAATGRQSQVSRCQRDNVPFAAEKLEAVLDGFEQIERQGWPLYSWRTW